MRIGGLDRDIVIEQCVLSQDTFGGEVKTWTPFAEVWASFTPLRASERFVSQATHSEREAKFIIRHLPGVDEKMRISFDDLYWQITGIAEIGRQEGLELTAQVIK